MTTIPESLIDLSVLTREPAAVYHARAGEYLSSHLLADFRHCPLLYRRRVLGLVPREEKPAYFLGEAAHVRILEGRQEYEQRYAFYGPINPTTGKPFGSTSKAFAEWAAKIGKPVLTQEHLDLIEELAAGVARNEAAVSLLTDGVAEGVVRTEYCGLPCQIRMDWLNPHHGIVDLKTCEDLTWAEVDSRRYGYAYQAAFYRSVLAQVTGRLVPVRIVSIEKREPYRCGIWRVGEQTLEQCARENAAAIQRLKVCQETDHWPTGYEEERIFEAI